MTDRFTILEHIVDYEGLRKAFEIGPEKVIEEVKNSELRGRGGAGFLTGLKWEMTRFSDGEKCVVCNADEGEMGTFKDRLLLSEYPDLLIEGMAICCKAIDAKLAIIYLRWEYAFLVPVLETAMKKVKAVVGDITFSIQSGAGAYVCGEETALLDSLEGYRGEARNKPPFPVNEGYLKMPTVINNIETFCCIPHILVKGAKAFGAIGSKDSRGPKLFSISGDVENPGVYEFPLGTPLRDVLKKAGAKDAKAALVGGAGGVCVAKKDFGRTLAFEDLPPGGSIVVFNRKRNMLHVLKNLTDFFLEESCGQCVPCREGNYRMSRFIQKMVEEKSVTKREMGLYKELGETMKQASKCGLGQSAPNPFLSIVNNFPKEMATIVN